MQGHNTFFHFFKNRELNELYASVAIRSFAITLTGIFIPVFLYKQGYSFSSIFFFFALAAVFDLLFLVPSTKISYRFGLKHTMLFSIPPFIIFFLLLFSLEIFKWPLALLAFFAGIHSALFWFSYHVDFSKFSNKKTRGSQVGVSKIIISIFAAMGPLIGAFLITFFGFKVLFITVSFLLVVSTIPLFLTREIHEPIKFSMKGFFRAQRLRNIFAYMGNGAEVRIGTIVWPLFIFIFIFGEKYFSLGLVSSLAFTSSLIFTFLAGKFSDINRRLVLKAGTILNSVIWVIKSFIVTPLQVFIADVFYGASQATMHTSFEALSYDKTNDRNRARVILERESYIKVGGIILLLILSFTSDYLVKTFRYAGPLSSLMRFFF